MADVAIPEDIYEEIIRLYGYENIPAQTPQVALTHEPYSPRVALMRKTESLLSQDLRADYIETYPWVDDRTIAQFRLDTSQLFSLKNPLSVDEKYMRDSMIYNLFGYVAKNTKFFDACTVYDIGRCWEVA